MRNYSGIGKQIGELVEEKQRAYGDAFNKSEMILKVLFPDGVKPDQYRDLLTITRMIDKLFRIANDKNAFGESPYRDIAGYAILGVEADESAQEMRLALMTTPVDDNGTPGLPSSFKMPDLDEPDY